MQAQADTTPFDEAAAKRALRHTWHPFFARFGRITGTQASAILPIYNGADVLLSAPTATGKTEAVCAPILERVLRSSGSTATPSVMLVAPTRALCNDLARRLAPPVQRCGLRVDKKTGDSPNLSKTAPPHVLVTTPESLDSMLCRRPRFLASLHAVVFDELHLLDGDPRGDQLQCLSARLRRVAPSIQRCGTSATIPRIDEVAAAYLGADAVPIRCAQGQRRLAVEYGRAQDPAEVELCIRELIDREPGSKLLVFVNRRASVERLTGQMADLGVLGHHGSLSRKRRLRVERQFLNSPSGCCVATMTLEVGVDIGDIDRVVLVEPPADIASFRQRIGRANRRSGQIRVTLLHQNHREEQRFRHMVECARQGRLFGERIAFRPSVAAQQALSLAFQNPAGWISASALCRRLPIEANLDTDACRKLLAQLEARGWLYADSVGRFSPEPRAREAFERGSLHVNIDADNSVDVVDEMTRRVVGAISSRYLFKRDDFAMGGTRRSISRVRDARVFVERREGCDDVIFDATTGPRLTFDYCQDLARFSGRDIPSIRCCPQNDGSWYVEHFLGTIWGDVFAGVLEDVGFDTRKAGAFSLIARRSSGGPPSGFDELQPTRAQAMRAVEARRGRLARKLLQGPHAKFVDDALELRWLRESVDVEAFAEHLVACEFLHATGES